MEKIDKLSVSINGLVPTFVKLVNSWRPPILKAETSFRDHLVDFIRASIPDDVRVDKEYRHRGTTIDIYVSWKGILQEDSLSFELKKDLKKKTDFDRLVGQIEGLEPSKNNVLVVLVGDTDKSLLGRLRDKYARELAGPLFDSTTFAIVCVDVAKGNG